MDIEKKTLLLVEEEQAYGREIVEVLQRDGWGVTWARAGQSGLTAPKTDPTVVMVDASVEDFYTLEVIRELTEKRGVPLVMLCNRSDIEFTDRFLQDGAIDIIVREDTPVTAIPLLLIKALFMYAQDRDQKRVMNRLQGRYWLKEDSAARDPVTGFYTQPYIIELLQLELSHAKSSGAKVGILIVAVDSLAGLQDEAGRRQAGEILRETGQFITRHLRTSDLVGRYESDAFLCVLGGADEEGAAMARERILTAARKDPALCSSDPAAVLSCGMAVYSESAKTDSKPAPADWSALIDQASKHLQDSREAGSLQATAETPVKSGIPA